MSEYWKSTPRYWCKFCSTFVKDTKFEKQQHEATGRHQGSVQRSLRTLHKEHDKDEREKQRAKDEVARLNGVVSGKSAPGQARRPVQSASTTPKHATAEERKKQLKQLADLGVAVPEDYRKEVAMAGDWQTISVRRIEEDDVKPNAQSFGVRKRKLGTNDEEEEAEQAMVDARKGWGTTIRTYPGISEQSQDIEALLHGTDDRATELSETFVKKEEINQDSDLSAEVAAAPATSLVKTEEDLGQETSPVAPILFKKRKTKIAKT